MGDRSFSVDVKVGESLSIDGGRLILTVLEKSGQRAKLGIVHDGSVEVKKGIKATAGAEMAKKGLTLG